jgi:hypothetical protein
MPVLSREAVTRGFPWLLERDLPMIISTDEDGLLSAAFLHHHLGWRITGYYDCNTVWLSAHGSAQATQLVWVDLDITHPACRAIGHHILTLGKEADKGLQHICNPNLLAGIGLERFTNKYPFSTILFLVWIHDIALKKDLMARLLALHADSSWLAAQNYPENCMEWQQRLPDYDWRWLFQQVDSELFEKRMKERLLPQIQQLGQYVESAQIRSRHLDLPGGQMKFNPDWDADAIHGYFRLIGTHLKWSPPPIPEIARTIEGKRGTARIAESFHDNHPAQTQKPELFSYAFTHRDTLNFTELDWGINEDAGA